MDGTSLFPAIQIASSGLHAERQRMEVAANNLANARATRGAGGEYADLSDLFCAATRCPAIVGSDLVYRDDNHIMVSYARRLAPVLGMLAEQAIAPRS